MDDSRKCLCNGDVGIAKEFLVENGNGGGVGNLDVVGNANMDAVGNMDVGKVNDDVIGNMGTGEKGQWGLRIWMCVGKANWD